MSSLNTRTDPLTALLPDAWRNCLLNQEEWFQTKVNTLYIAYPLLQRIAYVGVQLFRAIGMIGFSELLPKQPLVKITICLTGSLLYRYTAEPPCTIRLATAAMQGQMAWEAAKWGSTRLSQNVAKQSFSSHGLTALSFVPALWWISGVIILSGHLEPPKNCCTYK